MKVTALCCSLYDILLMFQHMHRWPAEYFDLKETGKAHDTRSPWSPFILLFPALPKCQFKCWLFHFQSSSMLTWMEKQRNMAQILGPCWSPGKSRWSCRWLQSGPALAVVTIYGLNQHLSLSLSSSPSSSSITCLSTILLNKSFQRDSVPNG